MCANSNLALTEARISRAFAAPIMYSILYLKYQNSLNWLNDYWFGLRIYQINNLFTFSFIVTIPTASTKLIFQTELNGNSVIKLWDVVFNSCAIYWFCTKVQSYRKVKVFIIRKATVIRLAVTASGE